MEKVKIEGREYDVKYTSGFPIPSGMKGIVLMKRIYIDKEWAKDPGSLEHEAVHVRQQERDGWWRFAFRYVFDKDWRLDYEARAYAHQAVVFANGDMNLLGTVERTYATFLYGNYHLGKEYAVVLDTIQRYVNAELSG